MQHEVDMTIEWRPAWLSWVGATTMCLNALDVECDMADVAGHSGYAFALAINEGLCASGPTFVEWADLSTGIPALGRSILSFVSKDCYTEGARNDRTRAHAQEAFELAGREAQAGRPCVVWGLGVPEFGVVRGIDDDHYLCVEGGPTPQRVCWDAIDAPGGPYVLAFPTPVAFSEERDFDREAVRRGVMMLTRPDYRNNMCCGIGAYDYWISELTEGHAVTWPNSYNSQCWSEARKLAAEFLGRLADRHPAVTSLRSAHSAFETVSQRLSEIADLFPFTMKFEAEPITDPATIRKATASLQEAKASELQAIDFLTEALSQWD